MPALKQHDVPWSRKHDKPREPVVGSAATIAYPNGLEQLIELCRNSPVRLHAAGSHWALSGAAQSDDTFIETHDPTDAFAAMGRTLTDVVPDALTERYLTWMADQHGDARWSIVHIESGKRIYQLYAELDQQSDIEDEHTLAGVLNLKHGNPEFGGPWGFATLGGAGGQTVVGAFSTGTHGGDFDRPPVADSVLAIHLVADSGRHFWIEPDDADFPQLTDDDKLYEQYGHLGEFEVVRDTDVFEAALVSVGRFGVIYSVVLKALPQYELYEKRRLHVWQDIRQDIARLDSGLWRDNGPAEVGEAQQRFLQIAVSLTSHYNFQRNLAGVTRRWTAPLTDDAPGRKERVGDIETSFDPHLGGPRFERAGRNHAYSPDPDNLQRGADPGMLERACADGSFLVGIITAAADDLQALVDSDGAVVPAAVAAVAAIGGGGLLALLAALAVVVLLLRDLLEGLGDDTRFGELMNSVASTLLDPDAPPEVHAAGTFAWQLIYYLAFADQQSDRDYRAVSYAVMDQHDYLNISCDVNVRSVEVFFDATDSRLIAFIDALIAFEAAQEDNGRAFLGYASLRFTQPTRALIGMQKFPMSCAVEIACLADVRGGQELIDYAVKYAGHPMIGGVLHWGQHNPWTPIETTRTYGSRLVRWQAAFGHLGRNDVFSSDFTRQTGLEP